MNAEILCVGTELLLGDIVNTNAAYIAKELAALGINLYHQSVVGDNPQRLKEAVNLALSRCDLLVMTGGLGPTYDDLTKETVANYFGLPMQMHEPSLERIRFFFQKLGREMTPNNEKQAMMPKGAHVLTNNYGTAPGVALDVQGKICILLPGPPREMQPMFREEVIPFLRRYSKEMFVSSTIHIFGMGESNVEQILHDTMLKSENPTLAPYAKDGEVQLRVTARAHTEQEAHAMIAPMIQKVQAVLGEYIYGVDIQNLQNAVVKALQQNHLTLATAESCTGGLVSKRITEIPGASEVFHCGVCSYSNDIKESVLGVKASTLAEFGAVSSQTALEMARGVRALAKADIGVSITGIAGPDGGSEQKPVGLTYVGVSCEKMETVLELRLSRGHKNEREYIRTLASSNALNLVLKAIQKYQESK